MICINHRCHSKRKLMRNTLRNPRMPLALLRITAWELGNTWLASPSTGRSVAAQVVLQRQRKRKGLQKMCNWCKLLVPRDRDAHCKDAMKTNFAASVKDLMQARYSRPGFLA